eukprot:COSAG03_NODE_2468_length_2726_cov_7.103159_2_plen_83_part_00
MWRGPLEAATDAAWKQSVARVRIARRCRIHRVDTSVRRVELRRWVVEMALVETQVHVEVRRGDHLVAVGLPVLKLWHIAGPQ